MIGTERAKCDVHRLKLTVIYTRDALFTEGVENEKVKEHSIFDIWSGLRAESHNQNSALPFQKREKKNTN